MPEWATALLIAGSGALLTLGGVRWMVYRTAKDVDDLEKDLKALRLELEAKIATKADDSKLTRDLERIYSSLEKIQNMQIAMIAKLRGDTNPGV